jgi:hypothetical protein
LLPRSGGRQNPIQSKPVLGLSGQHLGTRSHIEGALGTGPLADATRRGVPAFRIMSDQALRAAVRKRLTTEQEPARNFGGWD